MKKNIIQEIAELEKSRNITRDYSSLPDTNQDMSIDDKITSAKYASMILEKIISIIEKYENK